MSNDPLIFGAAKVAHFPKCLDCGSIENVSYIYAGARCFKCWRDKQVSGIEEHITHLNGKLADLENDKSRVLSMTAEEWMKP